MSHTRVQFLLFQYAITGSETQKMHQCNVRKLMLIFSRVRTPFRGIIGHEATDKT